MDDVVVTDIETDKEQSKSDKIGPIFVSSQKLKY